MGQSLDIPRVIPKDWKRLDLIINKIKFKLGRDGGPTFTDLTITDLTASRLVATDASKALESVPGTSVHPEFEGITVKNSAGDIIFYVDDDEMYFTAETAVAIADGMCIGLLLALTYKT
ncbi:hypothetical protein LCGC14_0808200 [marine sediment metagenome]|uniref:Uncharacterized protein n=1 Tax=marine sediment metagenome TaxID=412755 RepID=A0A0F9PS51_9ZZZZ